MEKLLEIKNMSVTYKNKERRVMAVKNAFLDVFSGRSMGIVGESGSGKSTLAMALLRLLPQKTTDISGEAWFMGKDLLKLNKQEMNEVRWTEISVVFQKAMNSLSPVHRISEQVEDIFRVHEPAASKEAVKARTMELLKLVSLPERVYSLYPHEMSGGMLQRVSIAISLLHNPKLLIFDEATTALDVVTQGQILEEIMQLEDTLGVTRIMITHDMSVVASSCRDVTVIYAGEIVEVGPVKTVLTTPSHPYTQGLLKSFPTLHGEKKKLEAIPGFLPDLSRPITGCVFAPRCPCAFERCHREQPELQERKDTRVACFLAGGENK